jgi:hypothetical protein
VDTATLVSPNRGASSCSSSRESVPPPSTRFVWKRYPWKTIFGDVPPRPGEKNALPFGLMEFRVVSGEDDAVPPRPGG